MASMGGGGKQTSTTNNEPPADIRPFLKAGAQNLFDFYRVRPYGPDFFPGSTVAPFSPETQQALQMQADRAITGSPLTSAAQGQLTSTMAGDYLNPLKNENFQAGLNAAFQPMVQQFNDVVLPGITSQFANSGRTNSGLQEDSILRATSGLTRNMSNAAAQAASGLYGNERENQILGMKFAPELAKQDYIDINQLGATGSAYDAMNQALIDAARERYNYDQTKDFTWTSNYMQALQSGYPGGTSTTTARGGGVSPFQSILGTGLSLAGLAGSIFSDVNVKEDIEPVGILNNGMNVYRYRYAGDPTPRIGLMAQEVELTRPDAVTEIGGIKAVDYAKATQPSIWSA